ncbi:hypothetical protein SAMN05444483_11420 [Salegentibacter echinorum]|uniref:DUF2938 domain-containing protein n=1 Tax=Salegentibacter echinorum TaxID=1073325 RepID=A0A1M5KC85_SALEC|nr:hypothetical protein [Salegentibacter echinorum]SHG50392.1 hypothetical protein SAMN05444483_11420 [Salegentibacter echinorum]
MAIYCIYILLVSVAATTAMTAFSYLAGTARKEKFHEPELLNELIYGAKSLDFDPSKNNVLGWIFHFLIGLFFTAIFLLLYVVEIININILSALIFGIAAGVVGSIGWRIMFSITENPPKVHLKEFYLQLIIAHIIFSIFIMLGFHWIEIYILIDNIKSR